LVDSSMTRRNSVAAAWFIEKSSMLRPSQPADTTLVKGHMTMMI
jgi:hypothetical protein